MKDIFASLVLLQLFLIGSFSNAYPTLNSPRSFDLNSIKLAVPSKRAFDRLEASPFDFGAYAKRYSDDDSSFDFYRRKKSFDRLDTGPFSFGLNRKRSFDRVEMSDFGFNFQKRSVPGEQHAVRPLSLAEFIRNVDNRPFLYFEP